MAEATGKPALSACDSCMQETFSAGLASVEASVRWLARCAAMDVELVAGEAAVARALKDGGGRDEAERLVLPGGCDGLRLVSLR